MAEPKHTPGPWSWFGNASGHDIQLATVNGGRVFVMGFKRWGTQMAQPTFQVRTSDGFGVMKPASELLTYEVPYRKDFREIDHPDARLIAAAPDLLAALQKALDESGCDGELCMHDWHGAARMAIAKARGEVR